jgi:nicotinate-nucleotide adenylyltransferase
MNTLCFGGSFNPIHHGHLICARAVAEAIGCDQITLIPSGQPPHKPNHDDMAAADQRLAMCACAIRNDGLFSIDDIEMRQNGLSYTLYTVRLLRKRGQSTVRWLIGADMLNYLPQWHEPLTLLKEVEFVIMARPGFQFDWGKLPEAYQPLRQNVVEAPCIDISSTQIRERVRAGRSVHFLTPAAVADYIHHHRLYRETPRQM